MGEDSGRRTHRQWWFDPRLAIGIGLVVASIVGVLWVVASADGGVSRYVARDTFLPGDRIDQNDLVVRSVRLGTASELYLSKNDIPEEGMVVVRAVSAGELVPAAAVGTVAGERLTAIVVVTRGTLAKAVAAGAVVDVWSASESSNGVYAPPTVLVPAATVVRVIASGGIIADSSSQSVELLIPKAKTAKVLEAIANDEAISLVPASLPVRP